MKKFFVTEKAMRPASKERKCFYCGQAIENYHKSDCVLISKKVKIKMHFEIEIDVPDHWDKEMIEFHKNESSWCSDNIIPYIEKEIEKNGCICGATEFEYLEDCSEAYINED